MLSVTNIVERFVKETGFEAAMGGPAVMREGFGQIKAECLSLAAEAYAAEQRGADLSEACTDIDNYPHLFQIHNAVEDIWNFPLPEQFAAWVEQIWRSPDQPVIRESRDLVVWLAVRDSNPMRRALLRFFLFEGVRVNLIAVKRFFPEQYGMLGIKDDQISIFAETEVQAWLDTRLHEIQGSGAFEMIVKSAHLSFSNHVHRHVLPWFRSLRGAYVEVMQSRGRFEKLLSNLDAEHELLLRNSVAADFDEPEYTVEQLSRRHQLVLGGKKRNTLDQRLKRLRERLEVGRPPRPQGTTLQDILKKVIDDHTLNGEVAK